MHNHFFYRLGKFVYYLRWLVLCAWLVAAMACIPLLPKVVDVFQTTGFSVDGAPSVKADQLLTDQFGYGKNKFIVIYTSQQLKTDNPLFMQKIKSSLADLRNFKLKHTIIYPDSNKKQISKDKHTAYAVIMVKSKDTMADNDLQALKSMIKTPTNMTISIGGEPIFDEGINQQTQKDLFSADMIAAPLTVIMMLFIFESITGALIPIVTGAGCAVMILSLLYIIGKHYMLSIFTLNIALLLGLCLSLDYALFIISRFRYELRNGHQPIVALAITQATAGKAVFFSGLAVFVSLSALLLFPINILFSVGVGGLTAVFVAVTTANLVLPAILAILGRNINFLSIKSASTLENGKSKFWRWLVLNVVSRPKTYFVIIIALLCIMSYPITKAQFGVSDYHILPPSAPARQFFEIYKAKFNENALTPIDMILTVPNDILSKRNINKLYNLSQDLKRWKKIDSINNIVNSDPLLMPNQYYMLYQMPKEQMNKNIKTLLETTTREHMTVFTIVSDYPADSEESRNLVRELQQLKLGKNMSMQLSSLTLTNMEVFDKVHEVFPYAIAIIMIFTYVILTILLRSLILPLKAIVTTMLSLCASYGVLVFIIQQGHLSQLLNFQAQGMLDISLLVIIFCALFGFSMDYEVFLLTRIREHYDLCNDTTKSIVFGVEHSSRIITSAAIIVIAICCAFMVADIVMVKAFGLGIAVAIFTDAFLIRSLLVPAVMAMMGKLNWYLPTWLDKLLPRL